MKARRKAKWLRATAALLVAAVLIPSSGCALMFNQQNQTIRVTTTPPGRTIYIKGAPVKDGQSISIRKEFNVAEANVGTPERPHMQDLRFQPDLWLVGDAALLLVFVIPGLIALGVDFGAGTWRTYEDPQVVVLTGSAAPVEPGPIAPSPTPVPTPKPAPKPTPKSAPKKPAPPPQPEPSPIQP